MKMILATLFTVFSLLMSISYTSGGEWHSVGAPTPPYFTKNPRAYVCKLQVYSSWKGKRYMDTFTHRFEAQDFIAPNERGSFTIENAADPGMNGQSIYLSFKPLDKDKELVQLLVSVKLTTRSRAIVSSSEQTLKPVDEGPIRTTARVSLSPFRPPEIDKSVEVTAVCEAK